MRKISLIEIEEQIKNEELDLNPDFENIIVFHKEKSITVDLFYNYNKEYYDSDNVFVWRVKEVYGVDHYDLLYLIEKFLK